MGRYKVFVKSLKILVLVAVVSLLSVGTSWAITVNWKMAEIGGDDSEQGPYTGGTVEFIGNGFIVTATGGDIWSNKLGCTLVYTRR